MQQIFDFVGLEIMAQAVKMFVVVEFSTEGTVDIVHSSWLANIFLDNGVSIFFIIIIKINLPNNIFSVN